MRRFLKDKRGATAIEYTLIAALIGVALMVALQTTGADLASVWETVISPGVKTALSSG